MTSKKKKVNNKASVRELIHFQLNNWTRSLSHDLASSKIKLSSDLFEVVNKMLSSNDKITTAEATITEEKLVAFIKSTISKSDYRFDIKTFDEEKYARIKALVESNELAYDEFDPIKRREIELDNKNTRLGLWLENIVYQLDFDYKVVVNTGYANKPTILLNIVIGDK